MLLNNSLKQLTVLAVDASESGRAVAGVHVVWNIIDAGSSDARVAVAWSG